MLTYFADSFFLAMALKTGVSVRLPHISTTVRNNYYQYNFRILLTLAIPDNGWIAMKFDTNLNLKFYFGEI